MAIFKLIRLERIFQKSSLELVPFFQLDLLFHFTAML